MYTEVHVFTLETPNCFTICRLSRAYSRLVTYTMCRCHLYLYRVKWVNHFQSTKKQHIECVNNSWIINKSLLHYFVGKLFSVPSPIFPGDTAIFELIENFITNFTHKLCSKLAPAPYFIYILATTN